MTADRSEPLSADALVEARRAVEAMLLVAVDPTPVQLLAQLREDERYLEMERQILRRIELDRKRIEAAGLFEFNDPI